jgi:integrating conjugative element protein (TIGR03755 family)
MTSCTRSAAAAPCPWARGRHALDRRRRGLEQQPDLRRHEHPDHAANQLNGITNGFQQIMSNVIQSATSAVASLPALIIQRADPGLYNLLTNGVLQARLDFDRSKLTCRAMAEKMADTAGGQLGWSQMAEGMALRDAVSSTDAVSAIEQAETRRGNDGVPWVGGSNAGGGPVRHQGGRRRHPRGLQPGQRPQRDRHVVHRAASCASLSCQTWTSPQQATEWATRVLGEQEQRTCDACTKTETVPGVGLTPLIQEEYEPSWRPCRNWSRARNTTFENLRAAGSTSLPITRGVIEALRDEPDQTCWRGAWRPRSRCRPCWRRHCCSSAPC